MPRILVIEDELSVRENLIDLLEANEYEVLSAENGIVGITIAFEQTPDLILCDVTMPEIDGHEVLKSLRQTTTTEMIPFIFLTALDDIQSIRTGFEFGADDYLTKPFESVDLLKAVEVKLKKKADIDRIHDKKEQNEALSKVLIAVHMLKKLEPGKQRDYFLEIIKNLCNSEIELLKKMPELQETLSSEDLNLLYQLR